MGRNKTSRHCLRKSINHICTNWIHETVRGLLWSEMNSHNIDIRLTDSLKTKQLLSWTNRWLNKKVKWPLGQGSLNGEQTKNSTRKPTALFCVCISDHLLQYWSLLNWHNLRLRCGCIAVPVNWFFDIISSFFTKFKNIVHSLEPGKTPSNSASHQALNYVQCS